VAPDFLEETDHDSRRYLPPVPDNGAASLKPLIQITDEGSIVWTAAEVTQYPCRYSRRVS